jgi:fatty acid desaturase
MPTTTLAPPAAPHSQRPTSDFSTLLNEVRDAGLMGRRRSYYLVKMAVTLVVVGLAWACVVVFGHGWYQLGAAAVLGIAVTQLAFIGHEAAHRQIFASGRANDWLGMVISNLAVGLSFSWWLNKHNRHHGNPNTIGKDPDLLDPVIAFTPDQAAERSGVIGWIHRRQGYLFFPLLTLEGINLYRDAIKTVLGRRPVKRRGLEIAMLSVRLVGGTAVPFLLLPPGMAAAFLGVFLAVFGVYMGSSFAPNHKGMPLIEEQSSINFLNRQILTSRNIRSNPVIDWMMGGLNFQIEHHLFPSMPRPHLKAAQRLVRDYCVNRGIPYTEVGLFRSYGIVVQYLNRVGLGQRDPFDCPLAASIRPR